LFLPTLYLIISHCFLGNSRSTWKISKISDEIWSDLAFWDGDFGGSYFNTNLFLSIPIFFLSHLPPITQAKTILSTTLFYSFGFFLTPPSSTHFPPMGMAAAESQFHVLAVDDSIIDRKLIERLLRTSSYQGAFFQAMAKFIFFSSALVSHVVS